MIIHFRKLVAALYKLIPKRIGSKKIRYGASYGFAFFIVGWFTWTTLYLILLCPFDSTELGTFGDFFGSLNTLFSGLALLGAIASIRFQSDELKLQRNELKETKEVFKTQNFEITFFNLIKNNRDYLSKLKDGSDSKSKSDPIKNYSASLVSVVARNYRMESNDIFFFRENKKGETKLNRKEFLAHFESLDLPGYRQFNFQEKIGPYIRNLYNIYRLLDESFDDSELEVKKRYSRIVRAELSTTELYVLLGNCAFKSQSKKFHYFIHKYNLLKHLPPPPINFIWFKKIIEHEISNAKNLNST